MSPIENAEVDTLLAQAEVFARGGDTRGALDRARRARSKARERSDVERCELSIARLLVADMRRQEEALERHDAYVAREIAALPDADASSSTSGAVAERRAHPRLRRPAWVRRLAEAH